MALIAQKQASEAIQHSVVACVLNSDFGLFINPHGSNKRSMGASTIYVALKNPFSISVSGGDEQKAYVAHVDPYTRHHVDGSGENVVSYTIEPEFIDLAKLWEQGGHRTIEDVGDRIRRLAADVLETGVIEDKYLDLETELFGGSLPRRTIDARVKGALEIMRANPTGRNLASHLAERQGISACRLLHLFRSETGFAFRDVRAWKRARSVPHSMFKLPNLTDVAFESGYPDSTHFSHAIRKTYGIRPRDLRAKVKKSIFLVQG